MNLPTSISYGLPSCTKTVTVRMNGQVIQLKQNHAVVVNGEDITKVPFNVGDIKIRSVSSLFLQSKSRFLFHFYSCALIRISFDNCTTISGRTKKGPT